ncbi:MAG TPA: rhodanese-like domain-containing protein [bacterium]|nr:rhodanese-like domain-containing protein [bacterium]
MKIDKEQVFEKMRSGEAVVLNVLSRAKFNRLHIKGSENLPLGEDAEAFCLEAKERFGKEKLFILYCDHFGLLESYQAVQALEGKGFKARNYSGGLQEWFRAGLPVEGSQLELEPQEAV